MVWDLGPFAAVLVPGQTPPPVTKYKETIWNWKIASDMHSWVLTNSKIQKATKACCFWSATHKQGSQNHLVNRQTPKALLLLKSPRPTPAVIPRKEPARLPSRSEERAPLSCFQALLQHKSQWSLAWISRGARTHISNNSTIIFVWSLISVDILEK